MDTPRYYRRAEVPSFLRARFGVTISPMTLAKYATYGQGPEITYFGRIPIYREDHLLAWATSKLARRPGRLDTTEMVGHG
jgi:hypothetical protein